MIGYCLFFISIPTFHQEQTFCVYVRVCVCRSCKRNRCLVTVVCRNSYGNPSLFVRWTVSKTPRIRGEGSCSSETLVSETEVEEPVGHPFDGSFYWREPRNYTTSLSLLEQTPQYSCDGCFKCLSDGQFETRFGCHTRNRWKGEWVPPSERD